MLTLGTPQLALQYIKDVVQILILAWVFYKIYSALAETKATQLATILLYYTAFFCVCYLLKFDFLLSLYRHITFPLIVVLCIVYHPELRRAFSSLLAGRTHFFRRSQTTTVEQVDSILNACTSLVSVKRGALIIFPRHVDIKSVLDSGTKLNADLSSSLICTIFDHDTPLHDGAIVVQSGKILAAGCYLPLSSQTGIRASFGTRHRAALGLAEESDAIIIIVSEENGAMSLAYNANIYYNLDKETMKKVIIELMSYYDVTPQEVKEEKENEAKQ